MNVNVGNIDRSIRLLIAVVLVALGATGVLQGTFALAGYAVAAIALLTGLLRVCPLWSICKISTAK